MVSYTDDQRSKYSIPSADGIFKYVDDTTIQEVIEKGSNSLIAIAHKLCFRMVKIKQVPSSSKKIS